MRGGSAVIISDYALQVRENRGREFEVESRFSR